MKVIQAIITMWAVYIATVLALSATFGATILLRFTFLAMIGG